jgi:hypothetical protein
MKHTYKNHEIEVSAKDNGDFIEASAKFKACDRVYRTFTMLGRFPRR